MTILISFLFTVAALLLAGGALGVFALIDHRSMQQLLKTLGLLAIELAGVALMVWGCTKLNCTWAPVLPVAVIFVAHLWRATQQGIKTYHRSRLHTQQHYEYLLGNGATRLEALMPSVRRALRAAVVALMHDWSQVLTSGPLLLLVGMCMCGAHPVTAAVTTLLLVLTLLGMVVLTSIACIWLIEKRKTK